MRWMQREGACIFDEGSALTADEFAYKCLIHELGHAMGLASDRLPNGTDLIAGGQTYLRNGPHCNNRLGDERCNMYHNVYEAGTSFCVVCTAVLHGVKLENLPLQEGHNFDY